MKLDKVLKSVMIGSLLTICLSTYAQHAPSIKYFMQQDTAGASATPYGVNDSYGHYVKSKDAKIYYEVYGSGRPLYVLHGGGVGTPYEMGRIIDDLKDDFKVVVVASRGHGRSEIGHSAHSLLQKAEDIYAVMQKVSDEKAILLGFSDGGYTALKVAATYPSAVDRVIAIGAGTLEKGFFENDLKLSDLRKMDERFVEQELKIRPEPQRYQEFLSNYMQFWSNTSVGAEVFSKIKAPVLLVVGDEDTHAPVKTVLKAHQLIANSRLLVVPQAGHGAFIDNYEVVQPALLQFLRLPSKDLKGSEKIPYND